MRKILFYALITLLFATTAAPAHADIFAINAFKMPPAVVILPQPRPANLVPENPAPVNSTLSASEKSIVPVQPAVVKSVPVKVNAKVNAKVNIVKKTAVKVAAVKTVAVKETPAQKTAIAKATIEPGKNGKLAKGDPSKSAAIINPDANPPPIVDIDETIPLPPYPPHAIVTVGKLKTYTLGEQDTLPDVARYFNIGYVELRAANPGIDPWTPVPGSKVVIPSFKMLPRTPHQDGIVVNLAQMRLYYFKKRGQPPVTYPIGIGRDGLATPIGHTTIIRKEVGPYWYPTPRMRKEEPFLPAAVPPGPDNPLGTRALYLGWPEYRIHGTVKPWAVGRSVSSGCMRMYPRDIIKLFNMVPVGTHVTVVNQPILVGWVGAKLYLEADPSKTQNVDIEIDGTHKLKALTPGLKKVIIAAAGHDADKIDWAVVQQVVARRRGTPVVIANLKGPVQPLLARNAPQPHHDLFSPAKVTRYDFNR